MKKIVITGLLLICLLCFNRDPKEVGLEIAPCDRMTIFKSYYSQTAHIEDAQVIEQCVDNLNSLKFVRSNKEIDYSAMLILVFSYHVEESIRVGMDTSGVFWIDDTANSYEVSQGTFEYAYFNTLYERYLMNHVVKQVCNRSADRGKRAF